MTGRTTIDFGPDQTAALDRLSVEFGATKASILRFGLSLMLIAVREGKRGNSLGVIHGDRILREIAGVWDVTPGAA